MIVTYHHLVKFLFVIIYFEMGKVICKDPSPKIDV